MSILSGYGKFKRYILTDNGYKLCSQWTSSNTVHFDDSKTAQEKLGAIDGITDSLTATSSNVALSAKAGKNLQDQVTVLNTGLDSKFDKTGGVVSGPLQTTSVISAGGNAQLWSDNEGGNINVIASDGTRWEVDAHDGNLRIFNYENGYTPALQLLKTGEARLRVAVDTYTVTAVPNAYVSELSVSVKVSGSMICLNFGFALVLAISPWTGVHVATVSNWIGVDVAAICVSVQGANEPYSAAFVGEIDPTGRLFIRTHGGVSNLGWYYGIATLIN